MLSKVCQTCKKLFYKPKFRSKRDFKERAKFCSVKCRAKFQEGNSGYWLGKKRPNFKASSTFKRGRTPWNKGIKCLQITGEKHPFWKGEDVSYINLHTWVRRHKGKASEYKCIDCKKMANQWSNIDGKYKRELDNFQPRCRSCHKKYDLNGYQV